MDSLPEGEPKLESEAWEEQSIADSPQFQYWWLTLKLSFLILIFVRTEQDGNFSLYVEALKKLVSWFFSLDQTNYARWLPIYFRDLSILFHVHPEIKSEFCKGNFVIHKADRILSGMSIDHGHEQNSTLLKGSRDVVGLTKNPCEYRRWMVAGLELSRMLTGFENSQSFWGICPSTPWTNSSRAECLCQSGTLAGAHYWRCG